MRFAVYRQGARQGLAVATEAGGYAGLLSDEAGYPGHLEALLAAEPDALVEAGRTLSAGSPVDLNAVTLLPPLTGAGKIICVGLNYADHSAESGFAVPSYPALFLRVASSLIGHGAPLIRPRQSEQFDYEGELVAVIGRSGRDIPKETALHHVAGYSIFNDASVRDYQMKTTQWTPGKNFDGTGAFGPVLVTADELPPGGSGLRLQTRLNGQTVQDSNTDHLIFDIPTLVSQISEVMTLQPGDIIVTGTPAGVGLARKPPLWMKPGDVCEVEIEGLGVLRNTVAAA